MQSIKVTSVRSYLVTLKRAEVWKTSKYTAGDLQVGFIEMSDDEGHSGYGLLPGMQLEGEIAASAIQLLHRVVKPIILKRDDIFGIEQLMDVLDDRLPHNLQLKFAVEEALIDLQGKQLGVPAYELFGGLYRRAVPVQRILGIKGTPEEAGLKAKSFIDRGYTHVKMKIGLNEEQDYANVKAVREAIGPKAIFTLDANRAYNPSQAVRILTRLQEFVDAIEQPIGPRDYLKGLRFVRERISIPVMADESILTPMDAMRLIQEDAVDAVALKLWKLGGITRTNQIASLCNINGVACHVGTTPSSALLEAAQLAFCAHTPNLVFGAEIGEFDTFTEDPCTGLVTENGCLIVNDKPGFGVDVDLNRDNVREVVVD